jgi:hypothetical protein
LKSWETFLYILKAGQRAASGRLGRQQPIDI